MNAKTILTTLLFCLVLITHAQKEWSNWYFNSYSMMTFRNGRPEMKVNFIQADPTNFNKYLGGSNKGVAYSDPVTGEMRFLVSSIFAYDKNYDMIRGSDYLRVCPGDKYAYHIIPFTGNPDKFYIIQHQTVFHDLAAAQTGLQVRCPNSRGLTYSVLDLAGNNGLGVFTSMNNQLLGSVSEGISLIRHANGKDVWVVVHSWGDNKFWAYLFSDSGVGQPIVSAIGPVANTNSSAVNGHIIASHDGRTVAVQNKENHFIELYDFDNATGILDRFRTLPIPSATNGMQFSPDDSKLYFIGAYWTPGIYQFDFNAVDIAASLIKIADDPHTEYWDMQLGPDGKIYIAGKQYLNGWETQAYLSVINCPNLAKYACNFDVNGFATGHGYGQLPSLINDFIHQPKAPKVTEFSLGKDTAICFGAHKLTAPEGWEYYRWNTGDTTRELTVTEPGLYYVLAGETGFSCPTAFGSIKITNAARPLNLGRDTLLCPSLAYTLKVPVNFNNISWEDGETTAERLITESGTFRLRATDENGCANRDTIRVSFRYDPRANFGSDTTLCNDQTLTLELKPDPGWWYQRPPVYRWSNNTDKNSLVITQPGTYWGEVSFDGCTVRDTISIKYINAAGINLGRDTVLCSGDSLRLTMNIAGTHIEWSTGSTASEISVNQAGTYWVKVNNGSCTLTDTIQVSMQPRPQFNLGSDAIVCSGEALLLQPSLSGAVWSWQDGSSGANYTVKQAGLYWAKATVNGCSYTDSLQVTYKPLPHLNLGRDTGICAGQTLWVDAAHSSIGAYLWDDGATAPARQISKAGSYRVSVTGVNGCSSTDTIVVAVGQLPNFNLGRDTVLCAGDRLLLNPVLPDGQYRWNNGSSAQSLNISSPGMYWLEATRSGCRFRDSIEVSYKPLPDVHLGNDTTLCEGSGRWLDATVGGATYQWHDNSTDSRRFVDKPGLYHVTATLNGCTRRDTIKIAYRYKPRFSLGADTVLCTGQHFQLDPGIRDAAAHWQDGSVTPIYTVQHPGTYAVTLTNDCGSVSDEIIVAKGLCRLYLPNAFTPNNDGQNDLFRVKEPGFIRQFSMRIYNRWGQLVYESYNASAGWNGKLKGIDQPKGAYIWQVEILTHDGIRESAQGTIMLLR